MVFEVRIPKLVYWCIFRWGSVAYHFWVNMTLTSELYLRIQCNCVWSISPILFELGIPNLVCLHLGMAVIYFSEVDLISRIIVRSFISCYLREESQIFVYGCIFGCWYIVFHFKVTVILTYDLVSSIIVSGAYPLLFDVGLRNPIFGVLIFLGIAECPYGKKCTAANNFREQLANTLRLLGKHNLIWLTSIRGMFARCSLFTCKLGLPRTLPQIFREHAFKSVD